VRLSEVQRRDVQHLADTMLAEEKDASTIRNAIMPLRVIYRRAVSRGVVAVNPTSGVELPAVTGKRDRFASPEEAQKLIEALPQKSDQALWAAAFYAGLRSGEIMALQWENVDLAKGVIRVERSFDPKEGVYTDPKSEAGKRTVPIPAALRDYLIEHKLRSGASTGLVFEHDTNAPRRAQRIWTRVKLDRITLHEARHTYASLMIAAGVNAKSLQTYMGHSSVTVTYDRYGHLMPGNEEEATRLLDAYLEQSDIRARLAHVEG
jgi:integrase